MASILWFRRDLRLHDHPALLEAAQDGPVTALFVLDDALRRPSGAPRMAFLYRSLRALDEDLRAHGGRLLVRTGNPATVVPAVATDVGASSVHISADLNPYGAARDARVADALGAVPLIRTGSPYAIAPGRVVKADATPYLVFTPFSRAWAAHGWRAPAMSSGASAQWAQDPGDGVPGDPELPSGLVLPEAGEAAARTAWDAFRGQRLGDYPATRNRPDLDATSRLSVYLKWGALHPRTLLGDLGAEDGVFRTELCWREFYAAILHFFPDSARQYYRQELAAMTYDTGALGEQRLQAWKDGRTGYPIVDAGMRQLLGEGWMHNRVRMIVASFLVKDLHLEWTAGARHFMQHLIDGDLASNQHGWQWTAGTGTDAAPYFRIFNPVTQGRKFDPNGDYVRRYVPELRQIEGPDIHEPWRLPGGRPSGYVDPVVDHATERAESLARYQQVRTRR